MCFAPQRRPLFSTSKSGPSMVCFVHLTSKCASCHNGVHFFDVQKWSAHGVFCTFWLRNVLRATAACYFSSLIWPAGSAPAALAAIRRTTVSFGSPAGWRWRSRGVNRSASLGAFFVSSFFNAWCQVTIGIFIFSSKQYWQQEKLVPFIFFHLGFDYGGQGSDSEVLWEHSQIK